AAPVHTMTGPVLSSGPRGNLVIRSVPGAARKPGRPPAGCEQAPHQICPGGTRIWLPVNSGDRTTGCWGQPPVTSRQRPPASARTSTPEYPVNEPGRSEERRVGKGG